MMITKKFFLISMCVLVCAVCAWAHDGDFNNIEIDEWTGISSGLVHDETLNNPEPSEWKGWAQFTVKNTMAQDWGDFHIKLASFASASSVYFVTESPFDPYSTLGTKDQDYFVGYSDAFDLNGTTRYHQVDFTFYDNPVSTNETVSFWVYTNNQTNENEWFGFCIYPTPVPEPATIGILGLGATFIMARVSRKKR